MLPRYGFISEVRPSAYFGPGHGHKFSPRLQKHGSLCKNEYDLPPVHLYKERTTAVLLAPHRGAPPLWKPPEYREPPAWCQRLSVQPSRSTELNRSQTQASLSRTQVHSASNLAPSYVHERAGKVSLTASQSVPTLHPSTASSSQPDAEARADDEAKGHLDPRELKLIIEVEHCTSYRPTAVLKGSSEAYLEATERLDAAVSALVASKGCKYEMRVNPILRVTRSRRFTPDTPTAKMVAERQSAGMLVPGLGGDREPQIYPRIGAFEVLYALEVIDTGEKIEVGSLYSKLQTRLWPNSAALVKVLGERLACAKLPAPAKAYPMTTSSDSTTRMRPTRRPPPAPPAPPQPSSQARPASAAPTAGASSSADTTAAKPKQNIWSVLEAIDAAELKKAVRVAGLPEGRKEDMVKALVGKLQSKVVVEMRTTPKRKFRRAVKRATHTAAWIHC